MLITYQNNSRYIIGVAGYFITLLLVLIGLLLAKHFAIEEKDNIGMAVDAILIIVTISAIVIGFYGFISLLKHRQPGDNIVIV